MICVLPAERAGAADRNRAGVTEDLPLPLRCLYCERRTSAIYQLAFDEAAIDEIKGQCLEADYFGHLFPRSQRVSGALLSVQRYRARITSSREIIPASRSAPSITGTLRMRDAPLGEGLVSRHGTIRMT